MLDLGTFRVINEPQLPILFVSMGSPVYHEDKETCCSRHGVGVLQWSWG